MDTAASTAASTAANTCIHSAGNRAAMSAKPAPATGPVAEYRRFGIDK